MTVPTSQPGVAIVVAFAVFRIRLYVSVAALKMCA